MSYKNNPLTGTAAGKGEIHSGNSDKDREIPPISATWTPADLYGFRAIHSQLEKEFEALFVRKQKALAYLEQEMGNAHVFDIPFADVQQKQKRLDSLQSEILLLAAVWDYITDLTAFSFRSYEALHDRAQAIEEELNEIRALYRSCRSNEGRLISIVDDLMKINDHLLNKSRS